MSGNKNSGRKAKEGSVRTSILIDAEIYNYLSRNGNASAEVERITREDMGTYADSKKITITRRSKLGWDYTTAVVGNDIPKPEKPYYVGTYKSIRESIRQDRGFHSLGGTFYSSAWFARVNGAWRRIEDGSELSALLDYTEQVEVTVE